MPKEREIVTLLLAIVQVIEKSKADRLRQADRRAVGEGEDADVLLGNDVDAGGGTEKKGAAVAEHRMALCILSDVPAQAIVLVAGAFIGFRRIGSYATDLRLVRFGERVGVDELFAVPLTSIELQADPLGEIARAGAGSAGRGLSVGVAHEPVHGLAVEEDVQRGLVGAVFIVGET